MTSTGRTRWDPPHRHPVYRHGARPRLRQLSSLQRANHLGTPKISLARTFPRFLSCETDSPRARGMAAASLGARFAPCVIGCDDTRAYRATTVASSRTRRV